MKLLLWFTVACLPLLAQQPPPRTATVSGKVSHAMTGEPVRKAGLTLLPSGRGGAGFTATSDAAGKFTLTNVPPGQYTLRAEKAGFVSGSFGSGTVLTVKDDGLSGLDFRLQPQGVLAGRVIDEDGDPVQYAMVQAANFRTVRGVRQLAPVNGASSNDLGEFRIAGLPPGRYYLFAERQRARFPSAGRYARTYFPSVLDPASASQITIQAGQEIPQLQIQLRTTPVYSVRGRILAYTPTANQSLQLIARPETGMRTLVAAAGGKDIQADGAFHLQNVPPGQYNLTLMGTRGRPSALARTPVDVTNGDVDNVTLTVQPPLEVKGQVRFDGETNVPLAGIRAQVIAPQSNFGYTEATTAADGSFTLKNLSRDKMTLTMRPPAGTYVKQVLLGGQDVTVAGPDFTSGPAQMEITLGTRPGSITGTVQREKPEQATGGVWILARDGGSASLGLPARIGLAPFAPVDQTGAFSLKDVPPGEYQLLAVEETNVGDFPPEAFRKIASKAKLVEVKEGQSVNVVLEQVSRAELAAAGVETVGGL